MSSAVQKILSHYKSESSGVLSHLFRLLNHGTLSGTGKMVILPVDQGFEHGPIQSFSPNPPAYDPLYHVDLAIESGCNAFTAPLGFIETAAGHRAGEIPLILKVNHSDSLYQSETHPISSLVSCVPTALKLGCTAVGFTIYPASGERKAQYEQLAQVIHQAKEAGLVVVVWSYPRGAGISKQGQTAVDVVAYAVHIACQMGAHIVKVKPPSDFIEQEKAKKLLNEDSIKHLYQRTQIVIQSAFNGKRIVIFSGGPAKSEEEFLNETKELKKGGAFGSIIGRNAFQRPKKQALSLLKNVMSIYKN